MNGKNREWFRQTPLGMFIHWGMYSAAGRGEWVMQQEKIPLDEYDQLYMDQFTADEYDPERWARLAVRAGMEYIVLTAKHHDGFCLFATRTTDRNAVKHGPKYDLIRPYAEACRKYGLKVGLYYSPPDWSVKAFNEGREKDPVAWEAYIGLIHAQVRELMSNYGTIDILWYDTAHNLNGNSDLDPETLRAEELNRMVRSLQPEILINNRSGLPEDFHTAEQNLIPPEDPDRLWEGCLTLNRHWGYFPADPYYKPPFEIIRAITAAACSGGHLLLNVGPDRYGRINQNERAVLETVGDWIKVYGESVKGVSRIRLGGGSFGCAAQKGNKVYLYLHYPSEEGFITVPGCSGPFKSAYMLGSGQALKLEYTADKLLIHGTPKFEMNTIPVICLER
jgi:alpha-L-fucosidase